MLNGIAFLVSWFGLGAVFYFCAVALGVPLQ